MDAARLPSDAMASQWDAYVEVHDDATLGHAHAWASILESAYGIESRSLVACEASGSLRGVLPLARFRSLGGSQSLISLPFLDCAGPLASDAPTAEALRAAAGEAAHPVEIRQLGPPCDGSAEAPFGRVDLFLPLAGDEEELWSALPGKVRNQIRKARKEGLVLAGGSTAELTGQFYRLHRSNMRELGSPAHSLAFFAEVAAGFGERMRIFVASDGGQPVAALIAIRFAGRVFVPWASSLRAARSRCPNHLIYWEALRWAVESGAAEFDFGRSPPGSGTYRFKRGWGARERPLFWSRIEGGEETVPVGSVADDPRLQALSRLWRRLPAALCDRLGPQLRQRISS